MKIELLSENTALENMLWSGLVLHFYINDDWFCQIDYIGNPTPEYPYQFQYLSEGGSKHFETIKQAMYEFYKTIPEGVTIYKQPKIELEVTN